MEGGPPQPLHIQRAPHTPSSIVQTTLASQNIKTVPSDLGPLQHIPIQTTYTTMPSITTPIKVTGGMTTPPGSGATAPPQFQRLKVEDALSYLDQVKYKFSSQPQVYNDFLDIMKEFKSQCIDTPGVITRVSNLFKGYPELIIGFNTFLPPGYKIEVQANDTGYSLQVSVSMSSPPGGVTPHHSLTDMPAHVQTQSTINVVTNQPNKTTLPIFTNTVTNSVVRPGSDGGKSSNTERPAASPPPSSSLPIQSNHQTNQPVEFNHAINYVNKIKNRFQGQPEKYKRFLEILHTYQKEQKTAKNGGGGTGPSGGKQLTEAEVYSQVAKLFEHQEDLLTEFGQFLPDATSHNSLANLRNKVSTAGLLEASHKASNEGRSKVSSKYPNVSGGFSTTKSSPPGGGTVTGGGSGSGGSGPTPKTTTTTHTPTPSTKRCVQDLYTSTPASHHSIKRHKTHMPNLANFAGFEKIKKNVSTGTYENLMRVLLMYNCSLIGRSELMLLVSSVLCKHPELVSWVRELLVNELHISPSALSPPPAPGPQPSQTPSHPPPHPPSPRPAVDLPQMANTHNDLDLATCRRIGTSYYALPKNYSYPKCSGRTALCKQVLNDSWVSIPAWSEDANFVTSKKTQYEEYIYKCEDERFELDVVIECNASTIMVLEGLMKKMARMSSEELSRFRLDDSLGGTSPTTYVRAIKKLYGDKASDIIEGLRKNPSVSVPIVLKRLKAKEVEWRQAQKGFNKVWGEQNEKYYLKSLDHQGINFKANDVKALRSKTLYNEIEAACDLNVEDRVGPHLILAYKDRSVLDDAADLLIYHVKRQSQIHKEDKQRIKALLRHFLPDLFHHPRVELSDDEPPSTPHSVLNLSNDIKPDPDDDEGDDEMKHPVPPFALSPFPDEEYTLFFGNNAWYLFMRLHHILCERLTKMSEKAQLISKEDAGPDKKPSTAIVLRLKPKENFVDRYSGMLDMIKSVLDCSMELNAYEDNLRTMFGIHAYIGFTLDKVVISAVRQLQTLVSEESCMECWDLHTKEKLKGGAGGLCKTYYRRALDESNYQRQAALSVADNCYKMYIYKKDCKLTIELLDSEGDDEEEEDSVAKTQEKWSSYTEMHADPSQSLDPILNAVHRDMWGKAVYLRRNLKRWNQRVNKKKQDNNSNSTNGVDGQKMESCDETQCRILSNNKMVFVVNKDSCLYKKEALLKAKESHESISKYLYERFSKWYSSWSDRHVSEEQQEEARSWLLGLRPDTVPNITQIDSSNPLNRPPYRSYNRYRVETPNQEDSSVSSSSE